MFEKIGRYADTVAASAGRTRRGFLGRLGKGALGVTGLAGGVLLLRGEAGAKIPPGSCRYLCPDGTLQATNCAGGCEPSIQHAGMTCPLYEDRCGYY